MWDISVVFRCSLSTFWLVLRWSLKKKNTRIFVFNLFFVLIFYTCSGSTSVSAFRFHSGFMSVWCKFVWRSLLWCTHDKQITKWETTKIKINNKLRPENFAPAKKKNRLRFFILYFEPSEPKWLIFFFFYCFLGRKCHGFFFFKFISFLFYSFIYFFVSNERPNFLSVLATCRTNQTPIIIVQLYFWFAWYKKNIKIQLKHAFFPIDVFPFFFFIPS